MRVALLVLLLSFTGREAAAAAYSTCTGVVSGLWSATSTWALAAAPAVCALGPPGNGDTITVQNGTTVTIADSRIIGTSGVAGTVVITLNDTGKLVIGNGGFLKVRGDTTVNGSGSSPGTTYLTVQAGGIWEFDGSVAAVSYTFHCVNNFNYFNYAATGSSGNHAIIRSNASGPFGRFNATTNTLGGWVGTYTEFTRLGDASNFAIDMNSSPGSGSDAGIKWDITNSFFTACGSIRQVNTIAANGTFKHDNNVHVGSTGADIFHTWTNDNATTGTGTREVKGNVFDISFSAAFYPGGFTIQNNYFSGAMTWSGAFGWTSFSVNFHHDLSSVPDLNQFGAMSNSYTVLDAEFNNVHLYRIIDTVNCDISGSIFEQMGSGAGSDSGEFQYSVVDFTNPTTCTVKNNIFQPDITGHSTLEMISILPVNTKLQMVYEHNTWFGGWNRGATNANATADGAIQIGEGGNATAGTVASDRSNIWWNPQFTNYLTGFYGVADISFSATPISNYCTAANCDYNVMLGVNTTISGTNSGALAASAVLKGDAINTVNPEQNSKYIDPQFKFCTTSLITCYRTGYRTVASYDSLGLLNTATAWSGGATYSIGDFVSFADPTVPSALYWGQTINFRYINTAACAGANPSPVTGANWRNCWEWATLYRIRTDIAANGSASTFLATMLAWEAAGLAPTNTNTKFTYPGDANAVTNVGAVAWTSAGGVGNPGSLMLVGVGN